MDKKTFTVVIIDDEREVLDTLAADINKIFLGMINVEACLSIDEALTVINDLKEEGSLIPFVISDFVMPEGNGIDFFLKLKASETERKSYHILISGQANYEDIRHGINQSAIDICLGKPWQFDELSETLRELVWQFFLKYCPDQITHYNKIIPHKILGDAFLSSEKNRIELTHRLGNITRSLLDSRSASDQDLWQELLIELKQHCGDSKPSVFKSFNKDETIFREGETHDCLWFITKGQVLHTKMIDFQTERKILSESVGAVCGIMSFLKSGPTYTTLRATEDTEVAVLSKDQMVELLENSPAFLNLFMSSLLRQLNLRVRNSTEMKLMLEETLENLAQTQAALVESEKMATLGQLVTGIAHELNNPTSALLRGSDQITQLIPNVLNRSWQTDIRKKGLDILSFALTAPPISTQELRSRAKKAEKMFLDRNTSRKAVLLELDSKEVFEQFFKNLDKEEIAQRIAELDQFYQIGNFLRNINSCGERISSLVKSLKNYARPDEATMSDVDLHQGIEETLMIFQHKLKHLKVSKDYAKLPLVKCHPAQINQVWTNLISNAIDAMDAETGKLSIKTSLQKSTVNDYAVVEIEDNGQGIAKELQEKIFEPNFTTKRGTGFGLGLGLSIVKKIIYRHHGTIELTSEVGSFTRFTVRLPISH